jgi:hypothetical protein
VNRVYRCVNQVHGGWLTGSRWPHEMTVIELASDDSDLKCKGVSFWSNLDRRLQIGWLWFYAAEMVHDFQSRPVAVRWTARGSSSWWQRWCDCSGAIGLLWAQLSWPMMQGIERDLFQQHHDNKAISFHSPLEMDMVYNESTMVVHLAPSLRSACGSSKGSPSSKISGWQQ